MSVILLLQDNESAASKIWTSYSTLEDALKELIFFVESKIQMDDQQTYTDVDLKKHFDNIKEVCMLIEDETGTCYLPKDRDWIKKQIISYLAKLS